MRGVVKIRNPHFYRASRLLGHDAHRDCLLPLCNIGEFRLTMLLNAARLIPSSCKTVEAEISSCPYALRRGNRAHKSVEEDAELNTTSRSELLLHDDGYHILIGCALPLLLLLNGQEWQTFAVG